MILVLLLVTATFRPAQPAVGDLVTIEFRQAVTIDRSAAYEIVSQNGNRAVLRTFTPRPFPISGTLGGKVRFRNMVVPVRSVLKPDDDLKPAPLAPPRDIPASRLPLVMIAIAGALALLAWGLVRKLSRKKTIAPVETPIDPETRFRNAIATLRANPRQSMRWATLADETRRYLAIDEDLTTAEVLSGAPPPSAALLATILHQGDLEKFSPWGASPADFDGVAERALTLIPDKPAETPAEEVAA
jgi:hypothetical protein